ncbi:MAG TPA: o-succinylbenzoate--CoA ligase [Kiritimatiellia bacterium]|jgi:O-succinylbenzoic acid--CoA ligase
MTQIRDPLFEASLISKHEPAIVTPTRRLLYYEFDELVAEAAWRLKEAGVAEGERVALHLENSWEYLVLLLALLRIAAVACPTSTRLPRDTVRHQLELIGCRRLISTRRDEWPDLAGVTVLEYDDVATGARGGQRINGEKPFSMERPASIVFTSGSAGSQRAVLHTVGNHYYSALGANINIKVGSHDRWLLSLPLYHVGGLGILFRCIHAGATIAIPEADESLASAQERFEATHISIVSTQLYRMLKQDLIPPSFLKLKAILLGGGPVNGELLDEALRRKLPVYTTYGLTEMTSQVTTMTLQSPPDKRRTSGVVLKYRQCRISDDGEILVRGHVLFAGYVEGDTIRRPVDADGWFATGDLGRIDDRGYLTVTGRKDNMFVSGGENIQPEEIERALMAIEGVEDACVVPVPDVEFGMRPAAFIRWRNGGVDEHELAKRLEASLPRYKLPVRYLAWPADGERMKTNRAALVQLAREA